MDLALAFAIFRRLSGYPLDSQGNARRDPTTGRVLNVDGKQGLVIPGRIAGTERSSLGTDAPDAIRLHARGFHRYGLVKVPVFMRGTNDRRWEDIWPCCTFHKVDETVGKIQWTYGEDVQMGTAGSQNIVNPYTGEVVSTTPDTFTTRVRPGTWDVWYAISLWSKDPVEMMLLEHALKGMWDRQGTLVLETADGGTFPANYRFERFAVVDGGEPMNPVAGPGGTKDQNLRRDYTYRFEVMVDNTANGFGLDDVVARTTILERILEVEDFQVRTWQDPATRETLGVEQVSLEGLR